jgi:hypothetical protein
MMKVAIMVPFSDEDIRDIGDYLVLNYPPLKDQRNHSLNWLRKQVIKLEMEEVMNRRLTILRQNAANFKERRSSERETPSISDGFVRRRKTD